MVRLKGMGFVTIKLMALLTFTLGSSSFDPSLEMIPITESDVEFTGR